MLKKYLSNISRAVAAAGEHISRQQLLVTFASAAIMLVALVVFWNSFILPRHLPDTKSGAAVNNTQKAVVSEQETQVQSSLAETEKGRQTEPANDPSATDTTLTEAQDEKRQTTPEDSLPDNPDMYLSVKPVEGSLSKKYGFVLSPTFNDYRFHGGIDIAAGDGAIVKCVLDGVVESVVSDPGEGSVVTVNHGGAWKTRYSHLQSVKVQKDMPVATGTDLGALGLPGSLEAEEGCHLHLEVLRDGQKIDPLEFFDYK